jgi:hypothetical protein
MEMDIGKGDWLICVNDTPCFHTGDRLTLHRVYQVREVFDGVDGEGPARGVRLEGQIRAIAPCGEEWGWNINYFRPAGKGGMFNDLLTAKPVRVGEDA